MNLNKKKIKITSINKVFVKNKEYYATFSLKLIASQIKR